MKTFIYPECIKSQTPTEFPLILLNHLEFYLAQKINFLKLRYIILPPFVLCCLGPFTQLRPSVRWSETSGERVANGIIIIIITIIIIIIIIKK